MLERVRSIAVLNKLDPSKYTTYSLRVTAASVLIENDGTKENLQQLGDWKSSSVADSYVRTSDKRIIENSKFLQLSDADDRKKSLKSIFEGCTFNHCEFEIGK